ncbi:hypothetical protein MSAN_02426700 [Mycena sanguinolenta]|uniref:Tyr recombinase domain-containing protein n=1 Tax=Mycena sanguinolenta TaxID=230812 RepID=A0A8H6X2Y1_9AGAR|nr:hypothetical protein MSAN_02426700 [Mycena sanguinolenta]
MAPTVRRTSPKKASGAAHAPPKTKKASKASKPAPTKSAAKNSRGRKTKSASDGEQDSDLPSAASLLNNSQQTTDEWYKSPRTKKGYANYVKSGKKWLVDWTAEDRLGDEISADAFDNITAETPLALRALVAYKCEHLKRGFSSAEGIRSAFKDYFERVRGCQGDFWKYNSQNEKWEGNPVFESGFKTYYESLKNRDNRTGTSTQALPMLPADLKIILGYLDTDEAIKHFTVTQRLYFKAYVTTAFALWTRNDELVNLQFKHVKLNMKSHSGIPYHEFTLIFWKTNKDPTKGKCQKYMVQVDLGHPEIDCYTHLDNWKRHMEGLLQRPLQGTDFVFPAIASTGQLKFGECTSRSGFEAFLDEVVEKSGVMNGRNGKFTTHCFCRGVKWWGGWSSNENVGTLMRYLLDELMAYEEGFSDIMMNDRVPDRHETFMGENDNAPLSRADLSRLEHGIMGKIQALIKTTVSGLPGASVSQQSNDASVHEVYVFASVAKGRKYSASLQDTSTSTFPITIAVTISPNPKSPISNSRDKIIG